VWPLEGEGGGTPKAAITGGGIVSTTLVGRGISADTVTSLGGATKRTVSASVDFVTELS